MEKNIKLLTRLGIQNKVLLLHKYHLYILYGGCVYDNGKIEREYWRITKIWGNEATKHGYPVTFQYFGPTLKTRNLIVITDTIQK